MTSDETKKLERLARADRKAQEAAEEAIRKAHARALAVRAEFMAEARRLHAEGVSYTAIGAVLGVSKQRIHQLLDPH